jgi:hypothetical protein
MDERHVEYEATDDEESDVEKFHPRIIDDGCDDQENRCYADNKGNNNGNLQRIKRREL